MEMLIILIFLLLGIILPAPVFKPLFILLAGIGSTPFLGLIKLPYIASIDGNIITYATLDPLLQWALSLILIATAIGFYLDSINLNGGKNEN